MEQWMDDTGRVLWIILFAIATRETEEPPQFEPKRRAMQPQPWLKHRNAELVIHGFFANCNANAGVTVNAPTDTLATAKSLAG